MKYIPLKNADGSYIQCDDPRLDPIWGMCAEVGGLHHLYERGTA